MRYIIYSLIFIGSSCSPFMVPMPSGNDLEASDKTFVYPDDVYIPEEDLIEGDPRDLPPPYLWGEEIEGDNDTIMVGSWNIENLGFNIAARLGLQTRRMAELISHFDVMVIQEVKRARGGLKVAKALQRRYPEGQWGWAMSARQHSPASHPNAGERVMYFWKRHRIELLSPGDFWNASMTEMTRSPYWAQFKARAPDKAFDFILVSVHTKPGIESEVTQCGLIYERMKNRFSQPPVAGTSSHHSAELDVIIGGDFNAGIQASPADMRDVDNRFAQTFGPNPDHPPGLHKAAYHKSTMLKGTRVNDNLMWGPFTHEDFARKRGRIVFTDTKVSDHLAVGAMFFPDRDYSD